MRRHVFLFAFFLLWTSSTFAQPAYILSCRSEAMDQGFDIPGYTIRAEKSSTPGEDSFITVVYDNGGMGSTVVTSDTGEGLGGVEITAEKLGDGQCKLTFSPLKTARSLQVVLVMTAPATEMSTSAKLLSASADVKINKTEANLNCKFGPTLHQIATDCKVEHKSPNVVKGQVINQFNDSTLKKQPFNQIKVNSNMIKTAPPKSDAVIDSSKLDSGYLDPQIKKGK